MNLAFTAALLGIVIAGSILFLVRRDHLHGSYALWWLLVAAAALALGFFPRLVDMLGAALGVSYPPMLIAILGMIALLLKLLQADIDVSRRERRLRRMVQKVAILEFELKSLQERLELDARPSASANEAAAESTEASPAQIPRRRSVR